MLDARFTQFTDADYQAILGMNPLATGGGMDPGRYRFQQNMPLTGPLPPNYDNEISHTVTFVRDTSSDVNSGYSKTIATQIGLGEDIVGALKVAHEMSLTYTTTVSDTTETSRTATVTLSTTTNGCAADYAVYYDVLFNTLVFRKLDSTAQCQ